MYRLKIPMAALFVLIILQSCSTQQWYEGARAGRLEQCKKLPKAEYENCVREIQMDYEKYQHQRGTVTE